MVHSPSDLHLNRPGPPSITRGICTRRVKPRDAGTMHDLWGSGLIISPYVVVRDYQKELSLHRQALSSPSVR